ncbi:MAG: hypothetical protein M1833_006918 [Piccolia ochrophora]|nr:MAG: hypothetical protein M1833_006918 [Piccolia ochrophora]
MLIALNLSKSGYASVTLDSSSFFLKYHFIPAQMRAVQGSEGDGPRFTCRLYNKVEESSGMSALLSVFKARLGEARDRDTAIEKCELSIQDRSQNVECRIVVKVFCRHGKLPLGQLEAFWAEHVLTHKGSGVVKTYRLTYEDAEVTHALFDKNGAHNRWTISAATLKEFVEHFGPKTEQLDVFSENGRATFTSYTEKIMDGKEVLKQPLQTSVAIDVAEFAEFAVEEKLHIAISVRDFRTIVAHADTLHASITAQYSRPTRPMQLTYDEGGMGCAFTLMTIGDHRGGSLTPAPAIARAASNTTSRQASTAPAVHEPRQNNGSMPPPESTAPRTFQREKANNQPKRPSPPPRKGRLDYESLFYPDEDDDGRWDAQGADNEDEDMLRWDASADNVRRLEPSVDVV